MKNIYIQLLDEPQKNSPLALATIIETKGSTPQIPGASALFSSEGLYAGSVGGGLLEADAQKKALYSLQQKISLLYKLSLTAEISSPEGAICGGEATILIDAHPEDHMEIFQSISKSLSQRQPGVLATFISRYSNSLSQKENLNKVSLARYWVEMGDNFTVDIGMPQAFGKSLGKKEQETNYAELHEEIRKSLIKNKPNLLEIKGIALFENAEDTFPKRKSLFAKAGSGGLQFPPLPKGGQGGLGDFENGDAPSLLFLEPIYPLPHLIIAGAGHIGLAVSHLGGLLDFEVTVIDDRPEFANKERLPEADNIIVDDVGKAMQAIPISPDTYIVIVTRGHEKDADALRQCIGSEAGYIGMIGSARKIELMRKKFLQEGWATSAQWDRIHAPIGIDIQSKTVQEIAVSIAAQLVLVRRQNQAFGKSLSKKEQETE